MRLDEVAPELIKRVAQYRWDRIVEKHEGPWQWDSLLGANLVEFLNVNGFAVLLPVGKERHPSIGNSNAILHSALGSAPPRAVRRAIDEKQN